MYQVVTQADHPARLLDEPELRPLGESPIHARPLLPDSLPKGLRSLRKPLPLRGRLLRVARLETELLAPGDDVSLRRVRPVA